ncbi:hypothetical protein [Sediminitomix flava]|uniref:Uncharacterized protein n=1 Tax=Sediminitomix flava TaxID=379075 RepID=A0A315Z555_SEDFL|nr:hypothetical protein [Sediminitomix flava]PWJ38552.1 hypothetical protein BC781_107142 [Sediminitomix flava]
MLTNESVINYFRLSFKNDVNMISINNDTLVLDKSQETLFVFKYVKEMGEKALITISNPLIIEKVKGTK